MKPPGVGGMWLETPRAGGSSSPPGFPTGLCGAGVSDKYRPLLDGKATQKSLESQNGLGWKGPQGSSISNPSAAGGATNL